MTTMEVSALAISSLSDIRGTASHVAVQSAGPMEDFFWLLA